MRKITCLVLGALARNFGRLLSIKRLVSEISAIKPSFYKNVYDEVMLLEQQGLLKMLKAGNNNLIEFDFSSIDLVNALSELELQKSAELLDARKLSASKVAFTELMLSLSPGTAACVVSGSKSLALNMLEFLIVLPDSVNSREARASTHSAVNSFSLKTNFKTTTLMLTALEFRQLLSDAKANSLKHLIKQETCFYNPQLYWLNFYSMQKQGLKTVFQEATGNALDLTRDDVLKTFARHGYAELGGVAETTGDYCIETAIAAALLQEDARLLEAIPIVLAKNKVNYHLLEYLIAKHGKTGLMGFLLSTALPYSKILKENLETRLFLDDLKTISGNKRFKTRLRITSHDIASKLRDYHAT